MSGKAVNGKVTDQQEKFCQLYVILWNVGKAAKEADFAEKYGYELLAKPYIQDRIREIQRETGVRMLIEKATVMRETAYIGFSDITDVLFMTPDQLKNAPENVRKAIKKIKVKRQVVEGENGDQVSQEILEIELHSKTECLRLLAQITGAIEGDDNKKSDTPAFTGVDIYRGSMPKTDEDDDTPTEQRPVFLDAPALPAPSKKQVVIHPRNAGKTAKKKTKAKAKTKVSKKRGKDTK